MCENREQTYRTEQTDTTTFFVHQLEDPLFHLTNNLLRKSSINYHYVSLLPGN